MISEASVLQFYPTMIRDFDFGKAYYNNGKRWRASCLFEVNISLDAKLTHEELGRIEYRQYIRGGVWIKKQSQTWAPDDQPNRNGIFPIPSYAGESRAHGLPREAVPGTGLDLRWKEDGEQVGDTVELYGHRATATLDGENEADIWKPLNWSGPTYFLRDTPSVSGPWDGWEPVNVWVELWFKGYVVEVERDPKKREKAVPIRVLRQRNWQCFFQDKTWS